MGKYDAFLNGEIDEPIANAPSTTEPGKAPAGFKNPKYAAFLLGDEGSPSGDRSLGDVGYDLVSSFGVGANALLGMGGTLYGLAGGAVDNWATRQGEFGRKWWQDQKSAQLIDAEDNRKAKIDATEGEFSKAGVALWETLSSATLLSSFLTEQIPMLIPGGAAGRAAAAGAKAGGLGAAGVGAVATGTAVTTGGTLQGADAAQQAFDQLLRIPKPLWEKNPQLQDLMASNPSMTFDEAQEEVARGLARNTFAAAAAVSIATNLIPGAMGIERALVGVKAKTGGRIFNAAKGYVGETLQEGIEEGSAALFANIATGALDPEQRYFEGVGEATGMGMAAGPIGGVAGATTSPIDPVERKRTEQQKAVEARLAEAGLLADRESDQGLLPGVPVSIENEDGTTTTKVKIDEGNIRTFETDAPDSDVAKQWLNESLGLFETAQEAKRGPVKRPDGTVAYTDPMNVADAVMSAEGSVDDVIAQSLGIVGQSGAINSRIRQQEYLDDALADAGITEPVSRPEPEVSSIADLIGQHVLEQQDLQAAEPIDLEVAETGEIKAEPVPSTNVVVPPPEREYFDPRLARDDLREALQVEANALNKGGGGVGKGATNPETGETIRVTGTDNPDWFQSLALEEGVSVDQVKVAVRKAVAGERLGVRQERVITSLLDMFEGYELDAAADEYESRFEDDQYPADWDQDTQKLYDYADELEAAGGDAGSILDNAVETDEPVASTLSSFEAALESAYGQEQSSAEGEAATGVEQAQEPQTDTAPEAETDLLGVVPATEQSLADATRAKDTQRNTGDTDMTGTLFGADRGQVDIADLPEIRPGEDLGGPDQFARMREIAERLDVDEMAMRHVSNRARNARELSQRPITEEEIDKSVEEDFGGDRQKYDLAVMLWSQVVAEADARNTEIMTGEKDLFSGGAEPAPVDIDEAAPRPLRKKEGASGLVGHPLLQKWQEAQRERTGLTPIAVYTDRDLAIFFEPPATMVVLDDEVGTDQVPREFTPELAGDLSNYKIHLRRRKGDQEELRPTAFTLAQAVKGYDWPKRKRNASNGKGEFTATFKGPKLSRLRTQAKRIQDNPMANFEGFNQWPAYGQTTAEFRADMDAAEAQRAEERRQTTNLKQDEIEAPREFVNNQSVDAAVERITARDIAYFMEQDGLTRQQARNHPKVLATTWGFERGAYEQNEDAPAYDDTVPEDPTIVNWHDQYKIAYKTGWDSARRGNLAEQAPGAVPEPEPEVARPGGVTSKQFRDTRTGEIVTQVPMLEMKYFEEVTDEAPESAAVDLDKITLETAYEVEESGETVNVMENSGKLTRQLAKRANVISELRACIRG